MRNKLIALFLLLSGAAASARAGVIVLANRTANDVTFTAGGTTEKKIAPFEQAVLYVDGGIAVSFVSKKETRTYRLEPDSAYFFAEQPSGVAIQGIGAAAGSRDKPADGSGGPREGVVLKPPPLETIPIRVFVDEEEPSRQVVWEARIRRRIAAVSALTERTCRVRFEVAGADSWESDNKAPDLPAILTDFEKKVPRGNSRLMIGFTSQRTSETTQVLHLGGTRLPLHPYIMVREWTPPTEPGRLEVLIHEIGHYLGSLHSPETTSVMRPKLGDGRSVSLKFPVDFDPLNTLAMNLVVNEVRTRHIRSLAQLTEPTKERLRQIYREVQTAMPDDATPAKFLALLGNPPRKEPDLPKPEAPKVAIPLPAEPASGANLEKNARVIVDTIVKAADENRKLPDRATPGTAPPFRRSGDALTEYYFREAARVARDLPQGEAAPAFLVGVSIALDTADVFRKNPVTGALWKRIEPDEDRQRRLKVLGSPTIFNRHDSCQHFVDSAALIVVSGAIAEAAGLAKELLDSQAGGSGFSFADLASDQSGLAFGRELLAEPGLLNRVIDGFAIADFAVPPDGLIEGLTFEEFSSRYGSISDPRFLRELDQLRKRVRDLPGYNPDAPPRPPVKNTPAPPMPAPMPDKSAPVNVAPEKPAPLADKLPLAKSPEQKPEEKSLPAPSTSELPAQPPSVPSPAPAPTSESRTSTSDVSSSVKVPPSVLALAGLGLVALAGAFYAIWPRSAVPGRQQAVRTPMFSGIVLALTGFSLLGGAYARWALPPTESPVASNAGAADSGPSDLDVVRAEAPLDPFQIQTLRAIRVPTIADARAVWGATGRDNRGHIWFGVSVGGEVEPSARLLEYDPETDAVTARGDVLATLQHLNLLRPGECQGTIRTRIVQAADGWLYFASTDQDGTGAAEVRGSHLWRVRPTDGQWEHLLAVSETLLAAVCGGQYLYALGSPSHILYQYDRATGKVRSVRVGSIEGLCSSNVLADRHGHAYVPRLRQGPSGVVTTLVELNSRLEEVAESPLDPPGQASRDDLHGLVAVQPLADHSLAFVTDRGFLYRVVPGEGDRQARVTTLGAFHPRGDANVVSLFSPDGEHYLMGLARRQGGRYDWLVYDLRTSRSVVVPIALPEEENRPLKNLLLSGCMTRDDRGYFYVAGTYSKGGIASPGLMQIRPGH
jgi:hypothetical protein